MRETIKNEFFLSENNWIKDFLKKIIDFYLQVFSLFCSVKRPEWTFRIIALIIVQ